MAAPSPAALTLGKTPEARLGVSVSARAVRRAHVAHDDGSVTCHAAMRGEASVSRIPSTAVAPATTTITMASGNPRRAKVWPIIPARAPKAPKPTMRPMLNAACLATALAVGEVDALADADSDKTYTVAQVPAGKDLTQALELEEGLRRSYELAKLDSGTLREFSTIATLKPAQRATLGRAAAQLLQAESRLGAKPKRGAELAQALADVARIRENARILGGIHAKQVESMAARIVDLEARITQLRTRVAELTSEADGFLAAMKRELRRL